MEKIKRYQDEKTDYESYDIFEHTDGEWVAYEDHERIVEEIHQEYRNQISELETERMNAYRDGWDQGYQEGFHEAYG